MHAMAGVLSFRLPRRNLPILSPQSQPAVSDPLQTNISSVRVGCFPDKEVSNGTAPDRSRRTFSSLELRRSFQRSARISGGTRAGWLDILNRCKCSCTCAHHRLQLRG
jgi:hypothetical protein